MGDIHDERHVGFERVGDLARAEQADFLLHIGDGADLGLQLGLGFLEQPQRLGDGEGADAVVEGPRHGQVVAQQVEFVGQRDRVADAHELLGFLAAGDADVNEQVVDLRRFGVLVLSSSGAARRCRRRP